MTYYASSSIANFHDKLKKKLKHKWRWYYPFSTNLFVGMYHIGDYARFLWHRGQRKVFWCGSDILALETSVFRHIIPRIPAEHICENEVEWHRLKKLGIIARIQPAFFGNPDDFQPCFKPSQTPHVYICAHEGREAEYGLWQVADTAKRCPNITFHIYGVFLPTNIENVRFHGQVSEAQFNTEIRNYHACLRLTDFDGFSDAVAKSVLLGQYPITRIPYPLIDYSEGSLDLVELLNKLPEKQGNNPSEKLWRQKLSCAL